MLQPVYKFFRGRGHKVKREHIWIGNIPIQIFPNVSPLHNNAVEEADEVEVGGIPTKVIGVEHLIVLALLPLRVTDKWRIVQLLAKANEERLIGIIDRFGNEENQLHKRYQEVLESP